MMWIVVAVLLPALYVLSGRDRTTLGHRAEPQCSLQAAFLVPRPNLDPRVVGLIVPSLCNALGREWPTMTVLKVVP